MFEKMMKDLAWKCYVNNFNFNYSARVGVVEVLHFGEGTLSTVTTGYIKNWKHETPVEVVSRMHKELDEYVKGGVAVE